VEAWTRWPLLLGLCLQSSAWGTAAYDPATASLHGRMDGLSLCAPALASAVPQVILELLLSLLLYCFVDCAMH